MFYTVADTICLKKLGSINQGGEVIRVFVSLLQISHDFSVCRIVSLMFFHDIGENIPILRVVTDAFFYGFQRRECLETKFREITEEIFPVLGKRLVSMPYLPEMHISPVRILWFLERAA